MENSVEFDDIKFKCICLCCTKKPDSTDEQDNSTNFQKHLCCIKTTSRDENHHNTSFKKHLFQTFTSCWLWKRSAVVPGGQENHSKHNKK